MKFPELFLGTVISRYKRFKLCVDIDGKEEWAYLPNPGRLHELIYPGSLVWLKKVMDPGRSLKWEAVLGYDGVLVSLYAALANKLFLQYLASLGADSQYTIKGEVPTATSRFDFLIDGQFVEVKSVTLVQDGLGLFPDAPTKRGVRHLKELGTLRKGAVVFVVQRCDAEAVTFNSAMDMDFALAMKWARDEGVRFKAINCKVTKEDITPWQEIPVLFPQD